VSVDLGLRNKVALVTGSTSGIGEAIARRLAAEGARLMVHGRPGQAEEAARVAREINNQNETDADVELADLADSAACVALVDAVIARYGRIDILVNNAAISLRADLPSTDAALFDKIFAVNLRAPLLLIRAALPQFRKQGGGRVLNIGSVNASCGESVLLAYSMSKGGLATMTRNLADAHGQEGLRVNQLNPGWVLTDNEYRAKVAEGLSPDWPTQIPRAHAPAGRIFRPDEIAHFAASFLGVHAELVNGSVFDIAQFPMIGRIPVTNTGF
jgi:NAD(P)-dependent dehydrogenase (short-subunit alcohol dehydrogenase family)